MAWSPTIAQQPRAVSALFWPWPRQRGHIDLFENLDDLANAAARRLALAVRGSGTHPGPRPREFGAGGAGLDDCRSSNVVDRADGGENLVVRELTHHILLAGSGLASNVSRASPPWCEPNRWFPSVWISRPHEFIIGG